MSTYIKTFIDQVSVTNALFSMYCRNCVLFMSNFNLAATILLLVVDPVISNKNILHV